MSHVRRTLAALLVTVLATAGLFAGTARAAGPPAIAAADYIVSTFKSTGANPYGQVSSAADSLLALAATSDPKYADPIAGILTFLQKNAAGYVKPDASGVTGAAKLALVAAAAKTDPKSFGGVDLVAALTGGIGPNGSFGAYPGPFASGQAMVALARVGATVPDTMVDYLLSYAEPRAGNVGGGFACAPFPFKADGDCPAADPDSTAMAVLGLRASGSAKATAAATDALAWLQGSQQADGSWQNYSPVNSTGVVGPLFPADSEQATKATAYVVSKQLASGALSTGTETTADLLATQQGIFALTGSTYATIGTDRSPSATSSATQTAGPGSTRPPATPTATDPAVGWTVAALLLLSLGAMAAAAARNRRS